MLSRGPMLGPDALRAVAARDQVLLRQRGLVGLTVHRRRHFLDDLSSCPAPLRHHLWNALVDQRQGTLVMRSHWSRAIGDLFAHGMEILVIRTPGSLASDPLSSQPCWLRTDLEYEDLSYGSMQGSSPSISKIAGGFLTLRVALVRWRRRSSRMRSPIATSPTTPPIWHQHMRSRLGSSPRRQRSPQRLLYCRSRVVLHLPPRRS